MSRTAVAALSIALAALALTPSGLAGPIFDRVGAVGPGGGPVQEADAYALSIPAAAVVEATLEWPDSGQRLMLQLVRPGQATAPEAMLAPSCDDHASQADGAPRVTASWNATEPGVYELRVLAAAATRGSSYLLTVHVSEPSAKMGFAEETLVVATGALTCTTGG